MGGGVTKAGSLLEPRGLVVQRLWLETETGCGGTVGTTEDLTGDEDEEEGGTISGVTTAGIREDEEGRTEEEETENRQVKHPSQV